MQLSFEQTYKFALNSSSSKSQYLFPKAQRFPRPNRKEPKVKFYTLPSTISYQKQRAPSFPKLIKKMQFPEQKSKKIIPSPSAYSIKSDIDRSFSQRKGISIPKQIFSSKNHNKTPGPTDYTPIKQPYLTARYSIGHEKKKLEYPLKLQKGRQSPGPAYLVNVDKLQKVVSKYVHKKCIKVYSQPSLKRIISKSLLNPEAQLLLRTKAKTSSEGKKQSIFERSTEKKPVIKNFSNLFQTNKDHSVIQRNQTSVMGKFNKAERKTIFEAKSSTPGPGYNWFTQFSKLQKNVYNRNLQTHKSKKTQPIKSKP